LPTQNRALVKQQLLLVPTVRLETVLPDPSPKRSQAAIEVALQIPRRKKILVVQLIESQRRTFLAHPETTAGFPDKDFSQK